MSPLSRRCFLQQTFAATSGLLLAPSAHAVVACGDEAPPRGMPTEFQVACMTLPYAQFPLERALQGIQSAGYKFVAWGTTHRNRDERDEPVMAVDAPPDRARELARRCRDLGLEPLMMFSMIYPEHDDAEKIFTQRIKQAAAAGIPQILTFGHTEGDRQTVWVERFRRLAPIAVDKGVTIVVKQHGGTTGTGEACARIIREVRHASIRLNYDAGNVMDYLDVDPLPDLKACADLVHSFCIKDHRNWPRDEDCGPGYGEIDHYRLLAPLAFTGRKLPLCCENIFAPLVRRPTDPAQIDTLARRAREFLETVIAGLHA
ncbi:MAG: sugar phosphate isomerase/epimerase [Planctomycetaceae bacterium]|nr:sugar phosphate isomerase/epimerase [Planctomycetaceae bacterium]